MYSCNLYITFIRILFIFLYDIFTDSFLLAIRFTKNRKYLRIILHPTMHKTTEY